jgi:hypothetical protein
VGGFEHIGRVLMTLGIFILILGALLTFSGKLFGLGRLPGDIYIQRGNFTFYFPIVTSILLSIILSLVLAVFFRR